jgi:transcriptional regulator with AAA-type ATPase domain/tetratricopeptide (TPR) repeat protein
MDTLAELLGESRAIEAVRHSVRRLLARAQAGRRLPAILIGGETGTGKGLVARLIHRHGPRAHSPFVDVNCAAIPDALLEAELFGFERGAFTDARRAKPGLFQTAHRGTIFLDEVGLLPEPLQAKLLKVLEEQAVRRLGSTVSEPVDVAVISATNADLKAAMAARHFREDLYHRLAVLTLDLPPLRERGQDVVLLAHHFLTQTCADYKLPAKRLSANAEARLLRYPWPGNIRELANVMERVALLVEGESVEGNMLELQDMPAQVSASAAPASVPLSDTIRDHLLAALEQTKWNISHTATQLGISRNTVRARIERFELQPGATGASRVRAPARAVAPAGPPAESHPLPAPTASAVRWEQRRIGFLRVALIKSDADEPSLEANRVLDTLIQKAEAFGGRIVEITATGITAAFGLEPVEDAPRRAALTAMSMRKAVRRDESAEDKPLATRTAIHVAQVPFTHAGAVTDIDGDAKRHVWSVLDTLIAAAEPGTIAVSQPTTSHLARRFVVAPTAASGSVYTLTDYRPTPFDLGGHMGRFVGRGNELDLLGSRLEAARQGQGQLVALVGEAGIGKSRLVFQFHQDLAGQPITYLEGHCLSYGSTVPYHPILEVLRSVCHLAESDPPAIIGDKIRSALDDIGIDPSEAAPSLCRLLGIEKAADGLATLSPEVIKSRTVETLHALFLKSSYGQPLIMVIEDLHWVDQTSEEYLASLVERVAGRPILLVVTYRPEYRPPWILKSSVTQIALQPLAPPDSLTVVRGAFGTDEVADSVAKLILAKAEGNPFFLEELACAAREQGPTLTTLTAPETVQGVLLARIDRLPAAARHLLQAAAVIGKDSTFEILRAIADGSDDSLRDGLGSLQSANFIYETNTIPQAEYTFKHALTREVAYGSLPVEDRRTLHAKILAAIEAVYRNRLAEHVERLAHHAFHGEVWEQAVTYLRQAGGKALSGAAYSAAAAHFEQGLVALSHLPETRETQEQAIDLRFEVRHALFPLGQPERSLRYLREAERMARTLDDRRRLGWVSAYMCYYLLPKDLAESLTFAQSAHAIGEELGNLPLQVAASYYVGLACSNAGDYPSAAEAFRRAIRLIDSGLSDERCGLNGFPISMCRSWLAISLAHTGAFDEAIEYGVEALRRAEVLDHPYTLIIACRNLAAVHTLRGEIGPAVSLLERGLGLARDRHVTDLVPGVTARLGYALVLSGRPAHGVSLLAEAIGLNQSTGGRGSHSLLITFLAEGYVLAERLDDALACAKQALAHAREHHERGDEAYALRLHGEVVARLDPSAIETAGTHFLQALELARELGMRPLMAHCHLGLGTLRRRAGHLQQAEEHLGAALGLFSEMGMPGWAERVKGDPTLR